MGILLVFGWCCQRYYIRQKNIKGIALLIYWILMAPSLKFSILLYFIRTQQKLQMKTKHNATLTELTNCSSWNSFTLKLCRQCLLHDCWSFPQPWKCQRIVFSFNSRHLRWWAHPPRQTDQKREENSQTSEKERGLLVQTVNSHFGCSLAAIRQRFHHDSYPDDQEQGPDKEEVQSFGKEELDFSWRHILERDGRLNFESHSWAHGTWGKWLLRCLSGQKTITVIF